MTPIYHDNVSQFQHIAPSRALRGGGPKMLIQRKNRVRAKHAQVAAPDFSAQQGPKGQLEWSDPVPKKAQNDPQVTQKTISETT